MSARPVDYAKLPEAPAIVRMYVAGEPLKLIVGTVGFCDQKIRTLLKACGVPMRPPGRPGSMRVTHKPLDQATLEIVPPWQPSRHCCPRCNVRLDVGCRHFPASRLEAV